MSRDFNGTTDELALPTTALLRPVLPVTIAAWVKPDSLKTTGIFSNNKTTTTHRGVWFAMTDTTGVLDVNFGANTGTGSGDRRTKVSTRALRAGTWQHVAATVRGAADMTIYIGGADAGGAFSGTGGAMAYAVANGRIGSLVVGPAFFDG